MWIFIGSLAFLGMIIFCIIGIISKIRKKGTTKKNFIAAAVCLALFIMGVAFSPSTEESSAKADGERKVEDSKAKTEAKEKADATAKKKADEEAKKKAEEEKKKADAAAKKKAKSDKEKKEKEERKVLIGAFQIAAQQMVEGSNGVITDVNIEDQTNFFQVKVYVDELTWANSGESEKMSFATTIGTSIQSALAPNDTYVDILSATNHDVVATQKLFGGWKIKR